MFCHLILADGLKELEMKWQTADECFHKTISKLFVMIMILKPNNQESLNVNSNEVIYMPVTTRTFTGKRVFSTLHPLKT